MTTGSKTILGTSCHNFIKTYDVNGNRTSFTDFGGSLSGGSVKNWSGGDRSIGQRPYTVQTHTIPVYVPTGVEILKPGARKDRKMRVIRTRVYEDHRHRHHQEDHPYTMSATHTISTEFLQRTWDIFFDGTAWRPYITQEFAGDSFGSFGGSVVITQVWDNNDDIALLGKLRDKIAGTGFNAGVFLGEGREALNMIANSALQIRKSLTSLKHGNLVGAARALGVSRLPPGTSRKKVLASEMSNRWLELSYGWRPLLQDVHDGAGFLATRLNASPTNTYRVTRHRAARLFCSQKFESIEMSGETRVSLIAKVKQVNNAALSGLTDPASVIWELTPWSFVIDWFAPVGNYLQALSLGSALEATYVTTKTVRTKKSFSGLKTAPSPNPDILPFSLTYLGLAAHSETIQLDRTVSTSLSVPTPALKGLQDVPSWKRAANAVSLLTQLAVSKKAPGKPRKKGGFDYFDS